MIAADTPDLYGTAEWWRSEMPQQFAILKRATATFQRRFRVSLSLEDPSGHQDGPRFTSALELSPPNAILGGFYFSRYGRLFTDAPMSSRSSISAALWGDLRQSLVRDYGFSYVPESALNQPYTGAHSRFSGMSWNERFFCAFYPNRVGQTRRGAT
jgi:hypothetical protein